MTTEVLKLGYQPPNRMILEAFRIMGVAVRPATVTINNTPVEFQYDTEAKASQNYADVDTHLERQIQVLSISPRKLDLA